MEVEVEVEGELPIFNMGRPLWTSDREDYTIYVRPMFNIHSSSYGGTPFRWKPEPPLCEKCFLDAERFVNHCTIPGHKPMETVAYL